jgi:hypothetical protein
MELLSPEKRLRSKSAVFRENLSHLQVKYCAGPLSIAKMMPGLNPLLN